MQDPSDSSAGDQESNPVEDQPADGPTSPVGQMSREHPTAAPVTDNDEAVRDDQTESEAGGRSTSVWRTVGKWSLVAVGVLVVIALLLATVPVSSGGLDARPDPTADYDEAIERFDDVTADEVELGVIDACRSRRFVHGERTGVAVVLYHGLTNCPQQFVDFAEELHSAGSNVIIMRAPYHGLGDEDGEIAGVGKVGPLSVHDLRDYADESVDIAVGLGDRVEVLGLSMGGVLAMWTAEFRDDVDLVVALAPAISIPRVPHFLTTAMINIFNRLPDFSLPSAGTKLDHAYAGESTGALAAMFLLAQATENELSSGRVAGADEVIVVLNPDDDQVDNGEVTQLVERWSDGDGEVEVIVLAADGLPHDLIDPAQPEGDVDQVYPLLFDLLESGPS